MRWPPSVADVRQAARFAVVGLANTGVGLALIWGAMAVAGLSPALANLVGYAGGMAFSFGLNRRWTFDHAGPVAESLPRWLLLLAVCYAANLACVLVAIDLGADPYLSQALGIGIYAFLSFFGCRWFVFPRDRQDDECLTRPRLP